MFNPKFTISNQMVTSLSEISEIKSMVERSKLIPSREVFLKRAAAIKMAHTSTSIEGNTLKEYQVAEVAQGKIITAEEDQIKEVKNYLLALRKIDILSQEKEFTAEDILNVHKIVMAGLTDAQKVGAWRPGQVYIVNVLPGGKEEVAYIPPASKKAPILIKDLVDWLKENNNLHPIIRAGLFHYQFETIHPFTDGNGRTGRLMTLLHLYQSGWDFKKVLVLEDYYNNDRKRYYESLQTGSSYEARQTVDLSKWLEYYVEAFLSEARRVKDQILSVSGAGSSLSTTKVLDKDELKIIDFVVTLGQITSSDAVDILNVPKRTAQQKLKKLDDIKVLKKVGAGPATFYVIS
jgi:Fic family protein